MTIQEFRIIGSERFSLRDIREIHMTPKSKLHAILGTNGSGKSSLIEQMTLCAPPESDFKNGGSRYIRVEHKGSVYESDVTFADKKRNYKITKDGEVVYDGHSSTAHASYIKSLTGITPAIHAVRVGEKKFSSMTTAERREWFTDLCPNNYDYALDYFKRLTSSARDLTGTIKKINERLKKEKEELLSSQEENDLRAEIEALRLMRSDLMKDWRPMDQSFEEAMVAMRESDSKVLDLVSEFNKSLKVFCNHKGYGCQQDIIDELTAVMTELQVLESRVNDIYDRIDKIQSDIKKAVDMVGRDKDSIELKLLELKERKDQLIKKHPDSIKWLIDPLFSKEQLSYFFNDISKILQELEEDPDGMYSKVTVEERRQKHLLTVNMAENLIAEINKQIAVVDTYEHLSKDEHTTCPKCEHSWIRNYDAKAHQDSIDKLRSLNTSYERIERQKNEEALYLENAKIFLSQIKELELIARGSPGLNPLWSELARDSSIQREPRKTLIKLNSLMGILDIAIEINALSQDSEDLKKELEKATVANALNVTELNEEYSRLERELKSLLNNRYLLQTSVTGLKSSQRAMEIQERLPSQIQEFLDKRDEWALKAELASQQTVMNSVMMQIEQEITEKEKAIRQIDSRHILIKTLEEEVSSCKDKERLLTKAIQALSPAKGLIAKGLTGFINHFIAQMNAIIEKVWSYPLTIDLIEMNDEQINLDYKFPFKVNITHSVKDVELGSSAQREIFDLAFMLVSMVHLGLDDSEIFLDEFSINMDYVHRLSSMKSVMDIVANSNFSQVFLISHYESSYGDLSTGDITVLCKENIQLPGDALLNDVTKIVYR